LCKKLSRSKNLYMTMTSNLYRSSLWSRTRGQKAKKAGLERAFTVAIVETFDYLVLLHFAIHLLSIPTRYNEPGNIPSNYVCGSWEIYKCFSQYSLLWCLVFDTSAGLVYREYQNFGNVHMRRPGSGPNNFLSDIFRRQRVESFIHLLSGIHVSAVPHN